MRNELFRRKMWCCIGTIFSLYFPSFSINEENSEQNIDPEKYYQWVLQCTRLDGNERLDKDKYFSGREIGMLEFAYAIKLFKDNNKDCEPIYNELINFLKNDPFANIRAKAANMLKHLGDKKAIGPLTDALSDKSIFVQKEAARAIISLGDNENMKALQILGEISTGKSIDKMTKEEFLMAGVNPGVFFKEQNSTQPLNLNEDSTQLININKTWKKGAIKSLRKSSSSYDKAGCYIHFQYSGGSHSVLYVG
jgi:hypothetical protein